MGWHQEGMKPVFQLEANLWEAAGKVCANIATRLGSTLKLESAPDRD